MRQRQVVARREDATIALTVRDEVQVPQKRSWEVVLTEE
jgi:hypothetical protein